MVKRWLIDEKIDHEPVIFLNCSTEEGQCEFLFSNYDGIRFKVIFPKSVDAIEIKFMEATILAENSVAELIKAAQCSGPLNAFFVKSVSEQIIEPRSLSIDEFLADVYYGENSKKSEYLMQYIMVANRTWINVFSFEPPIVRLMDRPQGKLGLSQFIEEPSRDSTCSQTAKGDLL